MSDQSAINYEAYNAYLNARQLLASLGLEVIAKGELDDLLLENGRLKRLKSTDDKDVETLQKKLTYLEGLKAAHDRVLLKVSDLQGKLAQLETVMPTIQEQKQTIKALEKQVWTAEAKSKKTYCAFCGAEFPIDGENATTAVTEHIFTCKDHPMRKLEQELQELKDKGWEFMDKQPPIGQPVMAQFQHEDTGRLFDSVTIFTLDEKGMHWVVLSGTSFIDLPKQYMPIRYALLPVPSEL